VAVGDGHRVRTTGKLLAQFFAGGTAALGRLGRQDNAVATIAHRPDFDYTAFATSRKPRATTWAACPGPLWSRSLCRVLYAQSISATHILRGIRSESDHEYERGMRNINGDLDPAICTVFLMPPRHIAEVSSIMVKGLVGPKGWRRVVRKYVPDPVYERLVNVTP
jgi:pantetheine-phosphate adenylyltransferase